MKRKKIIGKLQRIIAISFVMVGIILLALGVVQVVFQQQAQNWTTTKGEVIATSTRSSTHESRLGRSQSYHLMVTYSYEVDGVIYTSDRYTAYGDYTSSSAALLQQKAQEYKVGEKVVVYYHPANPDRAILDPNTSVAIFRLFFSGGICTVVGLLYGLYLKQKRLTLGQTR